MNRIEPGTVELMGVTEVASLLKVAGPRIAVLRRSGAGFPAPVAELASGPVFCGVAVREFLATWKRLPGRPPIRRDVTKGEP